MKDNLKDIYEILKRDSRLVNEEGELLKNKIHELALKMDANLIKLLVNDPLTKDIFFTDADGILVFDKNKFTWVINSKDFLPDSYTEYKNKIMLIDENGNSISNSNDVVLSFPFKDCILEGGQSKEDEKRSEIFYNELLGKSSIDTLLESKVLDNCKLIDCNGENKINSFSERDNLFIRGNNLLSLSCLLERYRGKIKCIYIVIFSLLEYCIHSFTYRAYCLSNAN